MLAEVKEKTATPITSAAMNRANFPLLRLKAMPHPHPADPASRLPPRPSRLAPRASLGAAGLLALLIGAPLAASQVDYSGFTTCNPQRFGQRFVDKARVALPNACLPPACLPPAHLRTTCLPTYLRARLPTYMARGAVITCCSSAGGQP